MIKLYDGSYAAQEWKKDALPFVLGVESQMQLAVLKSKLMGTAKDVADSATTIDGVFQSLELAFPMKKTKITSLTTLKHKLFQSVQAFAIEFQAVRSKLEKTGQSLVEAVAVQMFVDALQPDVKRFVVIAAPSTLTQAIETALRAEEAVTDTDSVNLVSENKEITMNTRKRTRSPCQKCRRQNHTTSECKSNIQCFNCQKMGHFARECRKKVLPKSNNSPPTLSKPASVSNLTPTESLETNVEQLVRSAVAKALRDQQIKNQRDDVLLADS